MPVPFYVREGCGNNSKMTQVQTKYDPCSIRQVFTVNDTRVRTEFLLVPMTFHIPVKEGSLSCLTTPSVYLTTFHYGVRS